MDHKTIDYKGSRYGRLILLHRAANIATNVAWLCKCDCGTEKTIALRSLREGKTTSCGCYHRERVSEASSTHGGSNRPEYRVWEAMRARCNNPKDISYANYGGRGIAVCDRWLNSFENFYADMGPRPSSDHSIDRENVDGQYSPNNCRWATRIEQNRNRRDNVYVIDEGVQKCLKDATERLGLNYDTIRVRMRKGMTFKEATTNEIKPPASQFTMFNKTQYVNKWAKDYSIPLTTIYRKLRKGTPLPIALGIDPVFCDIFGLIPEGEQQIYE